MLLMLPLALPATPAVAGEAQILDDLRAFFSTADAGRRAALAARIAADPAYDRERVSGWLHRLDLYPKTAAGTVRLRVPVGYGEERDVVLRLPRGYTPGRAWPLLYALHPSGGSGPQIVDYVERLLGPQVEEFLVAAPTAYRQTSLDAPPPFTVDHLAILRAVRQAAHVDGDRVYAIGYSLGGYASWSVACLHADQLAGAVPIAGAFSIPLGDDGLWRAMLPNLAHLPVLNVWGERDTLTVYGARTLRPVGGIGEMNRRLAQGTRGLGLPLENVEVPGRGHGGVTPPRPQLLALLRGRREHYPRKVEHSFRHLHQGSAYWLEADGWEGPRWGSDRPGYSRRPGESEDRAYGRAVGALLGRLAGEVSGQTLGVERRHVSDLTVWIGDGMVDWHRPIAIEVGGRLAFEGAVEPDLLLCLTQAARTLDFDRLRWAGVRIDGRLTAARVTAAAPFPPLVPE